LVVGGELGMAMLARTRIRDAVAVAGASVSTVSNLLNGIVTPSK
jgi:hypothetical protein